MAILAQSMRRYAGVTALRGLLMVVAGIYAVLFPEAALTVLVLVGGILLIIDGALGLWSLTFGGGESGNYWFDVVGNALSLILGVLILISPMLATIFTVSFMVALVGVAALVVGVMQIVIVVRERDNYVRIWPVVLSGISYVLLGLLFLFFPMISASVAVVIGGVLVVVFGIGLLGCAWRLYRRSKEVEV